MTDDALFNLGIDLNREETVGGAIDRTLTAVRTTLGDTAITVWRSRNEHGSNLENGQSPEQPSPPLFGSERHTGWSDRIPSPDAALIKRCFTADAPVRTDGVAGPIAPDDNRWLPRQELFVPIDSERVLSVGWDHHDLATALDEAAVRDVLERAAGLLAAALDRISSQTRDPIGEIASDIRLGAFQQAIEDAADGVAILDDEAYVYIDQTHVDMYGFDSKQELLGRSWRELYAADEAARIEKEAFDALERDGHWQGRV